MISVDKLKKIILKAVVLLMLADCVVSAVFTACQVVPSSITSVHASDHSSSLGIFLINKSELVEKKEGKNGKTSLIELADFSELAILLSSACTKRFDFTILEHQHIAPRPPLFKIFCVFII